jgi:putative sterol carrier protein
MASNITELMTVTLPKSFIPEKAAGVDIVVQFKFTGSEVSEWYVVVKDQTCQATQGMHPSPKMTMTVDADSYLKISKGELDPTTAFMKGKVKVSGDMGVALKMGQYFKYGK